MVSKRRPLPLEGREPTIKQMTVSKRLQKTAVLISNRRSIELRFFGFACRTGLPLFFAISLFARFDCRCYLLFLTTRRIRNRFSAGHHSISSRAVSLGDSARSGAVSVGHSVR